MTKRVVVASGYFNPLHYGHVSYLEKARDLGTSLIVIVNNDIQAARRRASAGPHIPARERVKLVRSLQCVDAALEAIDDGESVAETLRLLHPDVFANGGGQKPNEQELKVCVQLGIQMVDGLGIQLLSLTPYTQHYDWGKPRNESIIAALTGQQSPPHMLEDSFDESKPFAELWMGDHPSGPARVVSPRSPEHRDAATVKRSTPLQDVIKRSPSLLGPSLSDSKQLPFLLKVLSIHKALSIQAHPDKVLAGKLHRERPDVYKDANHKPEIAIALSDDFQALCGFRAVSEIVQMLPRVPELADLIGATAVGALGAAVGDTAKEADALRQAYSSMMHAPDEEVCRQARRLHERAKIATGELACLQDAFQLVCKLYVQYPDDVGIFSVFFMNHLRLNVGECLYMAQNVPHAYISGDIVECMACSDNVVRGGLTPKFKDVEVLCSMLNYAGGPPATLKPTQIEDGIKLYADSCIEEFQVTHLHLPAGGRTCRIFSSEGPALALNLSGFGSISSAGERQEIGAGKVLLLPPGSEPTFEADSNMEIFVACCPPQYFQGLRRAKSCD
ncbi:unnamed protein product [Effrenium voratum]|nr:unnamed protein product [Effrenium voratum]CAJ1448792.1 unnamed protein product [Effrenium voratum]